MAGRRLPGCTCVRYTGDSRNCRVHPFRQVSPNAGLMREGAGAVARGAKAAGRALTSERAKGVYRTAGKGAVAGARLAGRGALAGARLAGRGLRAAGGALRKRWYRNPGRYYRVRVLPPGWFRPDSYRTQMVGEHTLRIAGRLARPAAGKKAGAWATQSFRLSKDDFAARGDFLLPTQPHAKAWWARFLRTWGRPVRKGADWMVVPSAKPNPTPPPPGIFLGGGTVFALEPEVQPIPNPYPPPGPAPRAGVTGNTLPVHGYTVISVENPAPPKELLDNTPWGAPITYRRAGPYKVVIHRRVLIPGRLDFPVLIYYDQDVVSAEVALDPREAARVASRAIGRLNRQQAARPEG